MIKPFIFIIILLINGCKSDLQHTTIDDNNSNPALTSLEALPLSFEATVLHKGNSYNITLHKFSLREQNNQFHLYDPVNSDDIFPLNYTPEVRSYRGVVNGQSSSIIIGYIDGNNHFYGRVFYGGTKSWEITQLPVTLKKTPPKQKNDSLNRSPDDLQPLQTTPLPIAPSLKSPIPNNTSFHLTKASIAFHASAESYNHNKVFDNNIENAIGAMDYAANLLDYVFSRDALIRFSYPGGLISISNGPLSNSTLRSKMKYEIMPDQFTLFHRFTEPKNSGGAAGNNSSCPFNKSLWCTLHEVGHSFNLGHDIGSETASLMSASESIPTNTISIVKSASGATRGLPVSAIQSRISPNANIDHLDTSRDVSATINVLANDFDANGALKGGNYSLSRVDRLSLHGGLVSYKQGLITYTPPQGFVGDDLISYTITDDTGMKDTSEVHIKVTSKARVLFIKRNQYIKRDKIRANNGNPRNDNYLNINQMKNLAGKEWYISDVKNQNYPNVFLMQQTLVENTKETVYQTNDSMVMQEHIPHELVPGKSSFSIAMTVQQNGDFDAPGTTIEDFAYVGQGLLDEGYAFSYYNGNKNAVENRGVPEKGLGWVLVSRQLFTQQSFSQAINRVHAFADPNNVTINDNQPHDIAWVINRENNTVTTYVDGNIVPMRFENDSTYYEHVPLPDGFEGIYPGGTHNWYASGRDFYIESYGPWFMRSRSGKDIWALSTQFLSDHLIVDNVQLFSYALSEKQITQFSQQKFPAYSPLPLNGASHSFNDPLTVQWKNNNPTSYRLTWSHQSDLSRPEFTKEIGVTDSFTLYPKITENSLYWRIDTLIDGEWILGSLWSVINKEQGGKWLELSFINDELQPSIPPDPTEWPINVNTIIESVSVSITGQVKPNANSRLFLIGDSSLTLSALLTRKIKKLNLAIGRYNHNLNGEFVVQYKDGGNWVDHLILHLDGFDTSYGKNGQFTNKPGLANSYIKNIYRQFHQTEDNHAFSKYSVDFPFPVNDVRLILRGEAERAVTINYLAIY